MPELFLAHKCLKNQTFQILTTSPNYVNDVGRTANIFGITAKDLSDWRGHKIPATKLWLDLKMSF